MRKMHSPRAARKKDDIDFEIMFFERVLQAAPNFVQALSAVGDLYTKAGHWQKGLEIDLRLSQLRPEDPVVFYNLACSYSLLNQTRPSLTALCKAIEFGYDDFAHLRKDGDLENLLKDQHVLAFIKELEKKKRK